MYTRKFEALKRSTKVYYPLSALNDALSFVDASVTTVKNKQTSIKPSFASLVASHSKELMKEAANKIFQKRSFNSRRYSSIVLIGLPEKSKMYKHALPATLHSIDVYCTISKVRRFGKLLPDCELLSLKMIRRGILITLNTGISLLSSIIK